jgi:lysine-arginine-ornithine-binding protein
MDDAPADTIRVAAKRGRSVPSRSAASSRTLVRALLAGLAVFVVCAFSGQGGAARAEERLRVIIGGSYPPFDFYNADGALAGFDIDIANALCAILAMRCSFIDLPWEQTIPALIAGQGDAIISSMSITAERKKLVAFTNRYYRTPMQFVARKGFNRLMTRDGLRGLRIGVNLETTAERYVRQTYGGAVQIVAVAGADEQEELYRALIQGKVDLAISDSLVMWRFTTSPKGRDFAFVGEPIYVDDEIGIAVRKEDEALRRRLNEAIVRIRLDGTYQKINAKYFPFSIY